MLSFPTQTVQAGAVQVDGMLDPDDQVWVEGDALPLTPIHVVGRLSAAGPGRFYFSGKVSGKAAAECRRCLVELEEEVSAESHLIYADSETEDDGDPDIFPLSSGRTGTAVDLRPAIREQWLLDVPAFALCRPDCKGLCPTCGANLNQGACSCARNADE
jgi:uncharacterized protein